jgi:hypothetical protein
MIINTGWPRQPREGRSFYRDDPDCEGYLEEINKACRILGDEEKIRQYDFICRKHHETLSKHPHILNDRLKSIR